MEIITLNEKKNSNNNKKNQQKTQTKQIKWGIFNNFDQDINGKFRIFQ